jgi:hypothetical protein
MAVEHYPSAELVFGWSFYRQGTSGGTSSVAMQVAKRVHSLVQQQQNDSALMMG